MIGRVITFYSFKGGAGRSMALANVGALLASKGKKVLVIDWDLEAPGLHYYFLPFLKDQKLAHQPGLIDLLWDHVDLASKPQRQESDVSDPYRLADLSGISVELTYSYVVEGGSLSFVSAGRQDEHYAAKIRDFDWTAFYARFGGGKFIDTLRERAVRQFDYVLIDSRTGVSDTAGVCTVQMPDIVVLCFTYNRQSIEGIANAAKAIRRQNSNVLLFPVAMRVEKSDTIQRAKAFAQNALARFLPKDVRDDSAGRSYWAAAEIPHDPNYAFEEALAIFRDDPEARNSRLTDMLWLARQITGDQDIRAPEISVEERRRNLRQYELGDPIRARIEELAIRDANTAVQELSALATDVLKTGASAQDIVALSAALEKAANQAVDAPLLALQAAEARTALYRDLSERDHKAKGALASSLLFCASKLSALGRTDEAQLQCVDAIALFREALATPGARPLISNGLGIALMMSSMYLAMLGKSREALADSTEAVEIRRHLAAEDFDKHGEGLSVALGALAARLQEVRQPEEALAALQEAVRIQRRIQGDSARAGLAVALGNLATQQFQMAMYDEARTATEEVITIYRKLASAGDSSFETQLAVWLARLSGALSRLGRYESAIEPMKEAVQIRRFLASREPDRSQKPFASALDAFSMMLEKVGRYREATAAVGEAIVIWRALLSHDSSDAIRSELAGSLNNAGNFLGAQGKLDEALIAIEEAVELYRDLAKAQPAAYNADLAMAATNLSTILARMGRTEQALSYSLEAVNVYRQLVQGHSARYESDFARALNNHSNLLGALGRRGDALSAIDEALELSRSVTANAVSEDDDGYVATLLHSRAMQLYEERRLPDAQRAMEEAITMRRRLAAGRPKAFKDALADSLTGLGMILDELGRPGEAVGRLEEAAQICRELVLNEHAGRIGSLAFTLNNLGVSLAKAERLDAATVAFEEAISLGEKAKTTEQDVDISEAMNAARHNLGNIKSLEEQRRTSLNSKELPREQPLALRKTSASSSTSEPLG
jgi:tetratricopeptide (TPR) repeat protein/MinD-like ATPase involved in chromosome partitioning or flagellar assembly